MRIFLKKKKWMAWVVMLVFLFVSIMPTAALAKPGNGNGNNKGDSSVTATVPTTDIAVEKIWDDKENEAQKRPDEIKVKLLKNTVETGKKLTLNVANDWKGDFKDVPVYDGNGKRIEYTVAEENVPEGYTSVITQNPVVNGIESKVALQKVPQSIKEPYSVTGANIIVIKAANKDSSKKDEKDSFYIWTKNSLSQNEQTMLIWGLNHNNPDLEGKGDGKGNSFTAQNTLFITGETSTVQTNKGSDTVTVKDEKISFGNPEVWAMFWYGSIELVGAQKAVITNTYVTSTPEPESTGFLQITKKVVEKTNDGEEKLLAVKKGYQFKITAPSDVTIPTTGVEVENGKLVSTTTGDIVVEVSLSNKDTDTLTVKGLPVSGVPYTVVEITNDDNSAVALPGYDFKGVSVSALDGKVKVEKDKENIITFINTYTLTGNGGNTEAKTGEFSFVKVDEADTAKTLAGAKFTLYSDEKCNYPETAVDASVVTSDSDGVVKFTGLKLGDNDEATYYLKETKAPVGYELSNVIYKVTFTGETDFAISNDSSGNSVAKADQSGYKITNTAIEIPPVTVAGSYYIAKNVVAEETVLEELKEKDFLFHVELAVVTTGSVCNYNSFEDAKWDAVDSATEPDNQAQIESLSVTVNGENVAVSSLMDNNYQFDLTVTGETTLGFNVDAQLATGSALIWARFTEDAAVATESDLQWEASTGNDSATVTFDGTNSWFGQLTSGSIYQFVNTYTNTATTPEEVIPWTPLVPSTPVEGGGDTGNENTGGNTGNENTGGNEGSNNDTDNTTTIVDEPTPLVNVPEEPMEELLEEPIEEIEIDEPEVPLTEAPGEPVAIEEPEVPLGDAPKTGDSSNAVLFVALMLAAGAGLVVTRRKFN